MSRAEQAAIRIHHTAALEAEKYSKEHGCSIVEEVAYGRGFKAGYIKGDTDGYEQAEKDLALTWKDIKRLDSIMDSMRTYTAWDDVDYPNKEDFYKEVLKRFNETKK